MRPWIALAVLTLVAVACGTPVGAVPDRDGPPPALGAPTAPEVATPPAAPLVASARPAPAEITPVPEPSRADPLTARFIPEDELLLMPLQRADLDDLAATMQGAPAMVEDAAIAAGLSPADPDDELADLGRFSYERGAGTTFLLRLRSPTGPDVSAVHSWVAAFGTDEDAAGYLEDYFADAAKGVGGGRYGLPVRSVQPFPVEGFGSDVLALTLEMAPGIDETRWDETLLGFRIGRLVAFVSVVHPGENDQRLRVELLSHAMRTRILEVLRGTIRPERPDPPPPIPERYEFRYRQSVSRQGVRVGVETHGAVAGGDVRCSVTIHIGDEPVTREYVAVGGDAWVQHWDSSRFRSTPRYAADVANDLLFCPGWSLDNADSGIGAALPGAKPHYVTGDGPTLAVFHLDESALAATGYVPEGSGVEIYRFDVTTNYERNWLYALDLSFRGDSEALADIYGPEFGGGRTAPTFVEIFFTLSRPDDPAVTVEPPD